MFVVIRIMASPEPKKIAGDKGGQSKDFSIGDGVFQIGSQ